MRHLINNQRSTNSELIGKQYRGDNSMMSLGERLRQTEFIDSDVTAGGMNAETSHCEMRKMQLPSNKYTSDTSQNDDSQL